LAFRHSLKIRSESADSPRRDRSTAARQLIAGTATLFYFIGTTPGTFDLASRDPRSGQFLLQLALFNHTTPIRLTHWEKTPVLFLYSELRKVTLDLGGASGVLHEVLVS
jgi:hypothetical protein